MKSKLFSVAAFFVAVIITLTCFFYFSAPKMDEQIDTSQQIVALNEISQLVDSGDTESAITKISELEKSMRNTENITQGNYQILIIGALSLVFKMVGIASFNTEFTPMAFIIPIAIIAVSFLVFSYFSASKIKKVEIKGLVVE